MDQELTLSPSDKSNNEENYLNEASLDKFFESFRKDLLSVLKNYWVSRVLFVLGVLAGHTFGLGLMIIVIVIDMLLQNPNPLYPRKIISKIGKRFFVLSSSLNKKLKKTQ